MTQSSDVTPHEPHRAARGPPAAFPQRTHLPAASAAQASHRNAGAPAEGPSQQTQSLRPREQAGHRKAGADMERVYRAARTAVRARPLRLALARGKVGGP